MVRVRVYTTPTCPWCVKVKEFLSENDTSFEEVDVSRDPNAAREMVERSGQMGVPVTDVDGEIIIGFDVEALKRALNL